MTVTTTTPAAAGTAPLTVTQLTPQIGAVIDGVRLDGDLDTTIVAAIRAAALRHRVIFFRGQDHLDTATQIAFARLLGPLTQAHPTQAPLDGEPLVHELDASRGGRAGAWHTDVTFTDRPPAFSVLRAVTVPPHGGDTLWSNTVAAYHDLPVELRELADKLRVYHTNTHDYGLRVTDLAGLPQEIIDQFLEFRSIEFETEHPDAPRVVHRVTVAGDIPVGLDGRPSVVRAGDASAYSPIVAPPVPA